MVENGIQRNVSAVSLGECVGDQILKISRS